MDTFTSFHQEKKLNEMASEIINFWDQGQFSSFTGVDEISIHYACFFHKNDIDETSVEPINHQRENKAVEQATIVIVPGRCEGYLKYQELAFDLFHQGYNLFIIDHRGQGLSGRLLTNLNKGYVVNFQDYVTDLGYFIDNIVMKDNVNKPYLLAHSMGGAISLRYMQDCPMTIKAAVIASPMLGFNSGLLPKFLAQKIVSIKSLLNSTFEKILNKEPNYFWGQKDYYSKSFTKNKLTHSTTRYQAFIDLYGNNKLIQLGGVTTHWLVQGIKAQKKIFTELVNLKTPILLLQAGEDSIVNQQAQNDFCKKLHNIQPQSCPSGSPSRIEGAYHELFFESDEYRNNAIAQTLSWFEQHQ
ncbi:alpha/beta fold hydrolase [Colwellia sp. E2M01]|uniref:alpha/beta fold hydrolase n=1 Tax=Colwellia sp. E2M01 TaxID=2841561 RepID=UPI001C0A4AF4|nr:alpha/beta fold hydrolase [Colwellia sp. E2M01]MBU2870139.1 alpha/beta fold hydrolase [Colwellia sp. E2M01]